MKKKRSQASRKRTVKKAGGASAATIQPDAVGSLSVDSRGKLVRNVEGAVSPGPRKQRKSGLAAPRVQTHKLRSVWFESRASWPRREAPIATVVRARRLAKQTLAQSNLVAQWESVGPTNIGGRMTCIVSDPKSPDRIWGGAAGGGVWHSDDGGINWQPQWHDQDVLNVGSLAIDPNNSNRIYCGTGEANLSADSYPGVGIYCTDDGGNTWRLLASCAQRGIPRRIGIIAIDPFDSNHLLLGGVGHDAKGDPGGLFVSTDGGVTWDRQTFVSSNNYWCHAVVFHPRKKGVVWATVTEQGARSGIWKSVDGGGTWSQMTGGLPDSARFGRTSLAVSSSNPDVIFALAADLASGSADRPLGVFRSADGGKSWSEVSGGAMAKEGQMSYGNTIAVDPQDPDKVICGGVDLYLTSDGGNTWAKVTRWDSDRGKPDYAHADHHGLHMPAGAPGSIYDMNDGGMDFSSDGGKTWQNRSNGLATTMFYDIDVAQSDSSNFGGGAQDNGTNVTANGGADQFYEILGGDGGWMVYDPKDTGHLYASWYNMGIFRWRGGQATDVSPPADDNEKAAVWMCYITMDPADAKTVFTGSYRVWRTSNDAGSWKAVSPSLDNSAISAIEVAPADSMRVYVGTEAGGFFRSTDGGNNWSPNMASSVLPAFTITRIETHPKDAQQLFVTVANFGHSHVFYSKDGGASWQDIDNGQLPDVPHHAVLMPSDDIGTLYVCNDAGVFVSSDMGHSWQDLSKNLPHVMVVDLVYHLADGMLYAATYGRSIYRIKTR